MAITKNMHKSLELFIKVRKEVYLHELTSEELEKFIELSKNDYKWARRALENRKNADK